jgi:hypothetical protein
MPGKFVADTSLCMDNIGVVVSSYKPFRLSPWSSLHTPAPMTNLKFIQLLADWAQHFWRLPVYFPMCRKPYSNRCLYKCYVAEKPMSAKAESEHLWSRKPIDLPLALTATTIRDNGIQTDKEIQNPVSELKITTHTPNPFALWNSYISHWRISKIQKKRWPGLWSNFTVSSPGRSLIKMESNCVSSSRKFDLKRRNLGIYNNCSFPPVCQILDWMDGSSMRKGWKGPRAWRNRDISKDFSAFGSLGSSVTWRYFTLNLPNHPLF